MFFLFTECLKSLHCILSIYNKEDLWESMSMAKGVLLKVQKYLAKLSLCKLSNLEILGFIQKDIFYVLELKIGIIPANFIIRSHVDCFKYESYHISENRFLLWFKVHSYGVYYFLRGTRKRKWEKKTLLIIWKGCYDLSKGTKMDQKIWNIFS